MLPLAGALLGAHPPPDTDWPPVLIALVLVVVVGGAVVAFNFLRHARSVIRRPPRGDGTDRR